MREKPGTPAAVAATMLHALFGDAEPRTEQDLLAFQQDAAARITVILRRFGGALLCDSVGLGKTHVAAAIIRRAVGDGATALVTAPAQLRPLWTRQLRHVRGWAWASHTSLSRRSAAERLSRQSYDFVIVDEAHGFRNAATRRYSALARLVLDARVLLITATPVNNTLLDFYNLVRLFAADDTFAVVGVTSLRAGIEAALTGRPHELRRVVQHLVVRRTRDDVRCWETAHSPGAVRTSLRFPAAAETELVEYGFGRSRAVRLRAVLELIPDLRFAAYGMAGGPVALELMRIGLLKRLESSSAAFEQSIDRLMRITEMFRSAAAASLLFDVRRDASLAAAVDGALQLSFDPLTLARWPQRLDRGRALLDATHDLRLLRNVRQNLRAANAGGDPKSGRLLQLVRDELTDDRIVIFTEYRATAAALWRQLERLGGVACVHGGEARLGRRRTSRRVVIERFAPVANHAPLPRPLEAVRILIATDVLSEGMNLQDARIVVSYDMPWNPVRLAQRAGRIDRLGSPHEHIRIIAFRPDRRVDDVIGLMRRLRAKLYSIRVVGGDAPAPFARSPDARAHIAQSLPSAREQARIEYLRIPPLPAPARRAVAHADRADAAALCCVRAADHCLLVLLRADGSYDIDGAAAWTELRRALRAVALPTAAGADLVPAFRAAERRALALARRAPHRAALPSPDRRRASRFVHTWLAGRPGGPAAEDFATADRALDLLLRPARFGVEREIRALLRSQEHDAAMRRLAELSRRPPGTAPANSRPRVIGTLLFQPLTTSWSESIAGPGSGR